MQLVQQYLYSARMAHTVLIRKKPLIRKRKRRKENWRIEGHFRGEWETKRDQEHHPSFATKWGCAMFPLCLAFCSRLSLSFLRAFLLRRTFLFFPFDFLTSLVYPLLPSSRPRLHLALFAPSFPRYSWPLFLSFHLFLFPSFAFPSFC